MANQTQTENWKPVVGYTGLYEVSDIGNVRSLDRVYPDKNGRVRTYKGKVLSPATIGRGYKVVALCKEGKQSQKYIHKIIAESFLGHTPDGYNQVIDHIDDCRSNNSVENLQIISHRKNTSKGWKLKKNKTSSHIGVCRIKSREGIFQANIQLDGKNTYLGSFDSAWEYQMELYHYKSMNDKW